MKPADTSQFDAMKDEMTKNLKGVPKSGSPSPSPDRSLVETVMRRTRLFAAIAVAPLVLALAWFAWILVGGSQVRAGLAYGAARDRVRPS